MSRLEYWFERVHVDSSAYAQREYINLITDFWDDMIDGEWLTLETDNLFMNTHVVSSLPLDPVRLFQVGLSIYDNYYRLSCVPYVDGVISDVLKLSRVVEVEGFFLDDVDFVDSSNFPTGRRKVIKLNPEQYWAVCESLHTVVTGRIKRLGVEDDSYNRMLVTNVAYYYSSFGAFVHSGMSEAECLERLFCMVNEGVDPAVVLAGMVNHVDDSRLREYAGLPLEWVSSVGEIHFDVFH